MAKLNRVRVHAEYGCIDSVGGFRYEREDVKIEPNTLYRLKVQKDEVSNPWTFRKDGKQYLGQKADPKDLRK